MQLHKNIIEIQKYLNTHIYTKNIYTLYNVYIKYIFLLFSENNIHN